MKKLILWFATLITGCQTGQQAIPTGEKTYRCEVSDSGSVQCQPEWEFKKEKDNGQAPK